MTGMLQPNDGYRERVERHQAEAQRWAEVDRLGRLARANRPKRIQQADHHHHTLRTYWRALRMHLHAMLTPSHAHRHHGA